MDHRNYQLSWLCSLILLLDSSSLLAPLLVSHFVTKVALKVEDPNGAGFNSKREVDTGNHKEQKNWKPGQTQTWCTSKQRLTNMDWTTWVYTVYTVEVCTGSKLKPEPGPYPRSSDPTRPDSSGTVKFRARTRPEITPPRPTTNNNKKRKKVAFHDCMQRNGLIKALPFHKHLPVMKVCEHQVQRSHTFCRVYEFCMDKKMMTVQIMVIFCQLRLVSILSTLNQT